jgi:hypothetical protein
MGVSLEDDRSKTACKAWFPVLADELTPYKAEVLCDVETDDEKKIRAFMTDKEGQHYKLERTRGKKYSISKRRIPTPAVARST